MNKRKIALTPEKSSRINGFGILSAEWGRNVGVCHSIQLSYERIYEINGRVPVIAF